MSEQLIEAYSRYQRARSFSERTITRRRQTLAGFSRFVELHQATTEDVEEWLRTKPAPRTRHAYRSDLTGFYTWAVRRGHLERNPMLDVDPIRVPQALPRPVGPHVFLALMAGHVQVRRMVALGLLAGLRCCEIASLDGADLWMHQQPPVLVVRNGKGGKDRIVAMHPMLVALLKSTPRSGPIFPGRTGVPVGSAAVSRRVNDHLRRCGIEATAHQLRHTFGTEMAKVADGDLLVVAATMGHSDPKTTLGYVGWSGESAKIIELMFKSAQRGEDAA